MFTLLFPGKTALLELVHGKVAVEMLQLESYLESQEGLRTALSSPYPLWVNYRNLQATIRHGFLS